MTKRTFLRRVKRAARLIGSGSQAHWGKWERIAQRFETIVSPLLCDVKPKRVATRRRRT